jgi:hypothetical protein
VTRRLFAVILVVFVSLLVVFASLLSEDGLISRFMLKRDRIIVERRPSPVYDELFPYYVELCATSQNAKPAKPSSPARSAKDGALSARRTMMVAFRVVQWNGRPSGGS